MAVEYENCGCAGCGGSGGEGSGRTVQEVCVIATAAPTVVMRWTRVIEDGGATIYYLDETGARYDGTLPAGHQIVDCPAVQPEPCRNASAVVLCDVLPEESPGEGGVPVVEFVRTFLTDCVTGAVVAVSDTDLDGQPYTTVGQVLQCESGTPAEECSTCETIPLCDVQPEDESPGAPLINFTELRLSELEDGPTSGTLPNGVTFTVSCGDWLEPQGHYTIYPVGGNGSPACDQVWTFDQPVYVRFGVRGFNVSPRECIAYEAPGSTFTVEFLHPNHRLGSDPDSICGLGSATDESIVRTDSPVTELTIRAVTNFGAGRGLGLLHVGLLADPQPEPGSSTPFLRTVCRDCTGAVTSTTDTTLDGQPYTPAGTVTVCDSNGGGSTEPCRDVSSTLLCDVSALETVTVLDTVGVQDDDGWAITSFTNGGCASVNAPDGPVPGPAVWSAGYLGVRSDRSLGTGCQPWTGYDTANVRWVLTKTFTAAEDGTAVVTADTFLADGGARVRVNGQDVGIYAQWNQPAVGGSSQVPVTAGPNVIEVEVRDIAGPNWLRGRLDIVMTRTTQFLRKQVTDCETGAVISVTDTTLDGEPYTVTGEVGQCQAAGGGECCPPPPPETRLDVATHLLCVQDGTGQVLGQVLVEYVYDDQTGQRLEQRLTTLDGTPYELPADAELIVCAEPSRPEGSATESVGIVELCDQQPDGTRTPFLRHLIYADGATTPTVLDTQLDGTTPYTPTGTVGTCSTPCEAQSVLDTCRWDDTDGDGVADTPYLELFGVSCDGALTSLGTYTEDLTGPYTPVSPVDPEDKGAPTAVLVEPHRIQLEPGQSWDASTVPLLQSVTVTAHGGNGQIVTVDGASTLFDGESVTWSLIRPDDAALTGPLTITAGSGTVTVSWTRAS